MQADEKLRIIKTWTCSFFGRCSDSGEMYGTIVYSGMGLLRENTDAHWKYSNMIDEAYDLVNNFIWDTVNDIR